MEFGLSVHSRQVNVVQVYFGWAGPCEPLTYYLRKVKLEAGCEPDSPDLVFASANATNIPDLSPFHGSCQPTWLFLISGVTLLLVLWVT